MTFQGAPRRLYAALASAAQEADLVALADRAAVKIDGLGNVALEVEPEWRRVLSALTSPPIRRKLRVCSAPPGEEACSAATLAPSNSGRLRSSRGRTALTFRPARGCTPGRRWHQPDLMKLLDRTRVHRVCDSTDHALAVPDTLRLRFEHL